MLSFLRYYVFTFFESPKNVAFYVFLALLHTFSRTMADAHDTVTSALKDTDTLHVEAPLHVASSLYVCPSTLNGLVIHKRELDSPQIR